jgi:hypothetical protein
VHSYYHFIPLVCCYCSMGYLSDSVDYSRSLYLEWFTDIGMFAHISSVDEERFSFTHGHGVWVQILQ